jgi:hypothetical protein
MKKILIIFALVALATFACARKHRYYDNSYDFYNAYNSSTNYSNYSSYDSSNSSYNDSSNSSSFYNPYDSSSSGSNQGGEDGIRLGSLEEVNAARYNVTLLQGQIDLYTGLVSIILTSAEHQDIIRNYTRRIRNIVALIDVTAVRNLVQGLTNEVFDSLRSLRNTLHNELVKLNNSANPTIELNHIIDNMKFAGVEEFENLKGYLIDSVINITQIHRERLTLADEETITDVKGLFQDLFSYLRRVNK